MPLESYLKSQKGFESFGDSDMAKKLNDMFSKIYQAGIKQTQSNGILQNS